MRNNLATGRKKLPIDHPAKILVVDDESGPREILQRVLLERGYQVKVAESGAQACQFIDMERFDLVLTDLNMPDIDGMDLLKRVRGSSQGTLVILITGYGSLRSAIEAIREGAYDYLTKPFQLDELYIVIKNATEKIRLIRENNRLLDQLREVYEKIKEDIAEKGEDAVKDFERFHALREQLVKIYTQLAASDKKSIT